MAEPASFPGLAIRTSVVAEAPRHSAVVRITHWTTALGFAALTVSGTAILLAHPRLYWGETGALGAPSLIDLPLPFMLQGQSGWGRSLHFLAAWISVSTGLVYGAHGALTGHFRHDLLPEKTDLSWGAFSRAVSNHLRLTRPFGDESLAYNVLQRLAYLAVVFLLFPLMIWTGLAMSPAITAVVPAVVSLLGGQQSARTLHFFGAIALAVFVLVHVTMVSLAGFSARVRAMITGRPPAGGART